MRSVTALNVSFSFTEDGRRGNADNKQVRKIKFDKQSDTVNKWGHTSFAIESRWRLKEPPCNTETILGLSYKDCIKQTWTSNVGSQSDIEN